MDDLDIHSASAEELKLEVLRLREQLKSHEQPFHSTGYMSPRDTWPDDSDVNSALADAESLPEAIFELIEKYEIPVTGNYPRWQDGQFIRHIGDFNSDFLAIADRFYGARRRPSEGPAPELS